MKIRQLTLARDAGLTTLVQLSIFLIIANEGRACSGVAKQLGISTTAVTGAADLLSGLGLARRHPSTDDRRVIFLVLTDKGQTLARNLTEHQ